MTDKAARAALLTAKRIKSNRAAYALGGIEDMSREEFLGNPKITSNKNASDLQPRALPALDNVQHEDFPIGGLTAKYHPDGAAVFDDGKTIASYNLGKTLVVNPKYRRKGIAKELVYQWRSRYPESAATEYRTKASQAIQEAVWDRVQQEKANRIGKSKGGAMDLARAVMAKDRAGGQIAPSKYLPNVPRAVHAGGGRENGDNGHIYVVHGGSDFDQIDPSYSGRGEPGNIRPLGKGLYGYVLDHADPENFNNAIGWATRYSQKYGGGKKTLHVYKIPKSSSTVFNGQREINPNAEGYPKPIKGLGLEPQEKMAAYMAHRATEPPHTDPAWWDWSRKGSALYKDFQNAADLRMEHLPIGLTEVAIQNPKVATRIGKFSLDTPTSDILDAVKSDVQGGNITKAEGGSVTDSDEFRNWFGNSVTHTDGDPHVLYTGTSKDKDFTSFNVGRHGAWFTRDPAEASQYAEQNDSQGYKQDGWKLTPTNTAGRVIPAYVKAENPYTGDLPDEVLRSNYKAAQSDWFDTLRRKGHDAWVPARYNGDLVVALKEPQQIKSIFNNGKFDPNQKHMNKAGGGEVDGEDDGITAYHGSAYDFPQFDINMLGKGTGHQAYGHGLYFAGDEHDAKMYRDMLKDSGSIDVEHESGKLGIPLDRQAQADLRNVSRNAGGDPIFAAKALQGRNPATRDLPQEKLADLIDRHRKSISGHMYKVKLNVKPEELLDWNKPLSEQHPNVQAALSRTMPKYITHNISGIPHAVVNDRMIEINPNGLTGRDAYVLSRMGKSAGESTTQQDAKLASEHLLSEGIKGIQYKQGGTHNYVMFHHDPVQVVDKYEYGGAIPKARDVSAALALTRRFTKDGKAATMALKPKGK